MEEEPPMKLDQPNTDQSAYERALARRPNPAIAVIAIVCVAVALAALLYSFAYPPAGTADTNGTSTSATLNPAAPRKP
jgi:FlaG/FlaF family flagellin (archaellin)